MKKFRVRAYGYKHFFMVEVHEDINKMREVAAHHELKDVSELEDTCAIVQPYERERSDGKKVFDIGTIRLSTKYLTAEVVSHECLHAAMWQYRVRLKNKNANFGRYCSEKEEDLCYIFGRIFKSMNKQLHKYGYWK